MVKENSFVGLSAKKDTKKTVVVPKKIVKKAPIKKAAVKPAVVVNKKKPVVKPKVSNVNLLAKKLSSKLA